MKTIAFYLMLTVSASAHSFYTDSKDPVFNYEGCCGGSDCSAIPASWVHDMKDGVRIIMTLEQAKQVNSLATMPVDAFIPEKRIQPSPDMEFHACVYQTDRSAPKFGIICFWGFRGV